jgi:hypothetical protein
VDGGAISAAVEIEIDLSTKVAPEPRSTERFRMGRLNGGAVVTRTAPRTRAFFINHEITISLSYRFLIDLEKYKSSLINYLALKGLLKEVLICDSVEKVVS